MVLTLVLIGVVGGFLSGLLGIGGGVVLLPLLVYGGQIPIKMATSVSMVVIIFASASSMLAHGARGNLDLSTGLRMGVASISGALVGSLLSGIFPEALFYWLYISLVAAAAVVLVMPRREGRTRHADAEKHKLTPVFCGLFQGSVTGVLGIGGGFIIVPLMIYFLKMKIHKAVGTSLIVILFSAVAGLFGKVAVGHFDIQTIVWVIAGVIPATQAGAWTAQKASPRILRLILAGLLIGILVWTVANSVL